MKRNLLALLAATGVLSGGFFVLGELDAGKAPRGIVERRINADLVQVRIDGRWESFPLVPLADSACQSGDAHLRQYCR